MRRRTFLAGSASLILAAPALAQGQPEKQKVVIGVGNKSSLYYLPLTIAERRGYFKDQGLEVDINDFAGGAKSLQALVGGSVDLVTGSYEHTIRMAAKRRHIVGVCELGRLPGLVLGVRKDRMGTIRSIADLKGTKIGVTAPGSSTQMMTQYAMLKAGLKPNDAAFIGTGSMATTVAAVRSGQIDCACNADPAITLLERDGDISLLLDTRTEEGARSLYGGTHTAAVAYAQAEFVERNPQTVQRLVNGFRSALTWIAGASSEEIADAVPTDYHLGDKALYIQCVTNNRACVSRTGRPDEAGMRSVLDMLETLDPDIAAAKIDLAQTFNPRFLTA